jgi:tetratricopeptide (TPR) repeat protein
MTEAPLDELRKALELERTRSEMTSFTRNEMGDLLLEMGNRTGALKEYRQALAIAERAVDEMPGMMQLRRELADCYERLGYFYVSSPSKEWGQARVWYGKALAVWRDWTRYGVSSPYNIRREQEAARMLAACDAKLAEK